MPSVKDEIFLNSLMLSHNQVCKIFRETRSVRVKFINCETPVSDPNSFPTPLKFSLNISNKTFLIGNEIYSGENSFERGFLNILKILSTKEIFRQELGLIIQEYKIFSEDFMSKLIEYGFYKAALQYSNHVTQMK